jgi:V8-like Glu-specific endopeptidase
MRRPFHISTKGSIPLGAIASALLLLPALAGSISAAGPTTVASARHNATIAHWTPERMRSAIPRDYVRDAASGRLVPARRPGGGSGGGVTGVSWTMGGEVLTATGKVYFELNSGAYICSGTVVSDSRSGSSIVLTAGHCGYDGQDGGFAKNWMFIPDFDGSPTYTCGSTVYGCWTSSTLVVNYGFTSAGGFNTQATQYDWTFAVVGPGGKNNTDLATTVGSFGTSFSSIPTGTPVDSFGYPAAGKYHGSDLIYCQNPVFLDPYNADLTYGISCGMTGGSSGGPWYTNFDTAAGNSGTIQSLNSYGYSGLKNLYGPKFNNHTQATYNAANGNVTGNTIVNG